MHLSDIEYEKLEEKPFNSQIFRILSSRYCRYVLYSFLKSSTNTLTIDELTESIRTVVTQTNHPTENEDLKSILLEEALPQLATVGAIDYDPRTQVVRYQRQPTLEEYAHHSAYQELPTELLNTESS